MINTLLKSSSQYFFIFILGFASAWVINVFIQSSDKTVVTNNKNIALSSSSEDLSWQVLQDSNHQLRDQVNQLQAQLTFLQQRKKKVAQITKIKTETKSHRKPASMRFLSVKFMKKSIPPLEYIIPIQLRKALELTEEQGKALAQLLRNKMATDLDIIAPILDELAQGSVEQLFLYGENGQIDNEQLAQQVAMELQSQQSYFENTITSVLTTEQINAYYDYEIEKATQQHNTIMSRQAQMIKRIPDLETYQQDEIQRFFDEQPIDLSQVKIASSRNPLMRKPILLTTDFKAQLQKQLEAILTPEQLTYYQENIELNF